MKRKIFADRQAGTRHINFAGIDWCVRAQAQLNETLLAIQAVPVPAPQVVIGSIASKIENGLFVDEPGANFVLGAIDRLIDRCGLMPAAYFLKHCA